MTCKECKNAIVNHSVVCGKPYEVISCNGIVRHNTKSAERCKRYEKVNSV